MDWACLTLGLIGSAALAGAQTLMILYVRARVASERRARVLTAGIQLAELRAG